MKSLRSLFLFMWLCTIFLIGGSTTLLAETKDSTDVEFESGHWNEGYRLRSSNPTDPLRAWVEGSLLFIQSNTQRSDITIRVSKEGMIVYEATIPKEETQSIIINLENSGKENYRLELENQWGDYLSGSFKIFL